MIEAEDKDAPRDEDNRERCEGTKDVITYSGRHGAHWWKNYTKWCDGKVSRDG